MQENVKIKISSHNAVAHLIDEYLPNYSYTVYSANSTAEAALLVSEGDMDGCITNELSRIKYNLMADPKFFEICMLWTLFKKVSGK